MKLTISLSADVVKKLDTISDDLGISRSGSIAVCISQYANQSEALQAFEMIRQNYQLPTKE